MAAANRIPGPGGWATILKSGTGSKTLSGGCRQTTNNRMELRAVIEGFRALRKTGLSVKIVSDSKYVTEAISKRWLEKWAAQHFRKAEGLPENADLWLDLRELIAAHNGFRTQDAIHLAAAIASRCDVFLTNDQRLARARRSLSNCCSRKSQAFPRSRHVLSAVPKTSDTAGGDLSGSVRVAPP